MGSILEEAANVMKSFPLCDSCLGRMFSTLMRGMSNEERGKALKRAVVMDILLRMKSGEKDAENNLREIARSLGEDFNETLKSVGMQRDVVPCYICGNNIREWKKLYEKAVERLKEVSAESFLVGVRIPRDIEEREEEVVRALSLYTAESIKSELKREIGKSISMRLGIPVEFKTPGAVVYVDVGKNDVEIAVNPLFIKGRYVKSGRNISQIRWFDEPLSSDSLSIEKMISSLLKIYDGSEIVLHASGREDVDVRMLGYGRPFVVEIKNPRKRRANLKLVSDILNRSSPYGRFFIEGIGKRDDVRTLKLMDRAKLKAYRFVAVSEEPVKEDDIEKIAAGLRGATIKQRTPTRVLKRRADIVRSKRIHDISLTRIGENAILGILVADGGLYVKELISGDDGRTVPSFSSLTGKKMSCAELDVLKVFI
ncbi:MAG: tRNA pseudouridine(54/55) synthase Pus10 [Fervidicoccaceae archaeon]